MMAMKQTISYLEMTLFSTVSFPDFLSSATNLMTSNSTSASASVTLFNIKVLVNESTNIYFGFHFRLLLYPLSARALFCQRLLG
jgi:hypothetical protein